MSSVLANGNGVVMATKATVGGLAMIERHNCGFPHVRGMACIAQFTSNWVSGRFIGVTADTVVTTGAVARLPRHGVVIKDDLCPGHSIMAGVASGGGWNMVGAFTTGHCTVMAIFTGIRGLAMVYWTCKGSPARACSMTRVTHIRC